MANEIDEAFSELASVCDENRVIRRELINQLRSAAAEMKIDPYDKATVITAKLLIPKTLDDLLKSDEDITLKRLKMKLSRKDSESNGNIGSAIVSLLRSIKANGEQVEKGEEVNRDGAMRELKSLQESNGDLAVLDGETEACGATPSTDGAASAVPTKKPSSDDDDDEE